MIPADTSPEAFVLQVQWLRRLAPGERLVRAMEMCDVTREMCREGIRRRHPEFDERQVRDEFARIVFEVAPRFS